MSVLTRTQIKEGYFDVIGGFPASDMRQEQRNFAQQVKDYNGQKKLCISCTQLDHLGMSASEKKRILSDWVDFLSVNTKTFKALHFNSRVPQALFDAACCQENLEELRFKWGPYKDFSALRKLTKIKFLYIGSGASVQDISILGELKRLIVLYIENFKRIEDYSPLISLNQLEQLVISGPILGTTPIKDLEFMREMKSLVSVWLPNTTIKRKYNADELENLYKHINYAFQQ